jgi:hypothetical protein
VPGRTYPLWRCAEFAALFLAFAPVPAALADTDDGIRIGALRAHLYYERSGFLSDDLIARDPPFVGWNTVIGAGDALEPADNILVVVVLDNPGGEVWLDETVTLRVSGAAEADGREQAFSGLLLGANSKLHLPLWLDDAGCVGAITITARFRK